tara:strand:- start:1721 stop:2755 length:1035 start_codon:yes stop_codon:yes gene_type:complete
MKNQFKIYLVTILVIFLTSCNGQNQTNSSTNHLKQLDNKLGITKSTIQKIDTLFTINAPSRMVRKIRKNKKGNLLITAFTDVIEFDGETFSKIPKPVGIESFDAFDALEDSKGNIWIASTRYGVFRYNGNNFTNFTTDNGLIHNRTMDIHQDKIGNIWIATMGGVSYYNGKTFDNFTTKEGLTNNDVNTIMEDKTGKIWFGTRGTLCLYNPLTSKFTQVTDKEGNSFKNVWTLIEDSKGNIWIGGEDGLSRYDGLIFTNLTTEFVSCVYEDKIGNIWTISSEGSLKQYNESSLVNLKPVSTEIYKNNSMSFRVIEDKAGKIWVGTLQGVFNYDGKSINYLKNIE